MARHSLLQSMMYDHLKKLKLENNFIPSRILDIGAWNGFWTNNVKHIWPDAHYTCIEAGPKHEKKLKEVSNDYHIAVLGDSNREIKMYLREIDKGNKKKITYHMITKYWKDTGTPEDVLHANKEILAKINGKFEGKNN